ncbi:hypothetical protein P0082_11850 [Candidatus Haliotispira prima]|uniref:Uncharacterized protein n=1 Tax=Candidatus Haliotispira prima TaxID=3034016 RepID=A0ABY8MIY4_9SPIO|nr:hypothetical protein P0082_11850 [Candidatus Haliotispira prima]
MAKLLHEAAAKSSEGKTLDYECYVQAYKNGTLAAAIAKHYHVSIDRVRKLAGDPDHSGEETVSSFIETMVALELERDGILGLSVGRGEKETDLLDGWGRMWDVKAPPTIPQVSFDVEVEKAIESVLKKLKEFPAGNLGILMCTSFLAEKDYVEFQAKLKGALTDNQKFLVRLVHIDGVL